MRNTRRDIDEGGLYGFLIIGIAEPHCRAVSFLDTTNEKNTDDHERDCHTDQRYPHHDHEFHRASEVRWTRESC